MREERNVAHRFQVVSAEAPRAKRRDGLQQRRCFAQDLAPTSVTGLFSSLHSICVVTSMRSRWSPSPTSPTPLLSLPREHSNRPPPPRQIEEHGVQLDVPQRFATRTERRVKDISLDILSSVLLRIVNGSAELA